MKFLLQLLLWILVLLGLHWALSPHLNPYYLRILLLVALNVLMATSLNLVNGYTGLFSLGHAGFMAVGAYSSAALSVYLHPALQAMLGGFPPLLVHSLLFLLSLSVGALTAALTGLLIGIPTLRLRGDYLAIATLGFAEIIKIVLNNTEAVGGARGFSNIPAYSNFFWIFAGMSLSIVLVYRLVHSSKGREFLAIRENEIAAQSLGISPAQVKIKAFVISSALAGLGGALYAHYESYITVNSFSFLRSIDFVVMVILGGLGNWWGVIIAAVLLTVLPETLRSFAEWRMIIYSLVIIFAMLIKTRRALRAS